MTSVLEVPFGVYGPDLKKGSAGQNWRRGTHRALSRVWDRERFDGSFATTTIDDIGTIQVRGDGQHWVVARTEPFHDRSQSLWRAVQLEVGLLWDWLLPVERALRRVAHRAQAAPETDLETPETLRLESSEGERFADRQARKSVLTLLCRLATLPLPASAGRTLWCPPVDRCQFEQMLVCGAFFADVVHRRPCAFAVLPREAAKKEHKRLLAETEWNVIFAPAARGDRAGRNTEETAIEPLEEPIRGVHPDEFGKLDNDEFDAMFVNFDGWRVPFGLVPPEQRTEAEWWQEYARHVPTPDLGELARIHGLVKRASSAALCLELLNPTADLTRAHGPRFVDLATFDRLAALCQKP